MEPQAPQDQHSEHNNHHVPHNPQPSHAQTPELSPAVSEDSDTKRGFTKIPEQWKNVLSLGSLIIGAVLLALFIKSFIFQPYEVFGNSMYPTLSDGDYLVISKVGKTWASVGNNDYIPERGEIIVFKSPREPGVQLIKRVIGLPGERVVLKDGIFTIYNEENPEGFDPDLGYNEDFERTYGNVDLLVPDGEVFVSGDNRTQGGSLDSRNDLGTVPANVIIGNLKIRMLPLGQAEFY